MLAFTRTVMIPSCALLGHFIQGITDLDHARDILEALRIAVDTWKEFHMKHEDICSSILGNLSFFVKHYASVLAQWNIPELVSESLMIHRDCPSVRIYGETLLDSMKKAESRHRRGNIMPTPKLRPVVEVRGHSIFFTCFFRLETLFVCWIVLSETLLSLHQGSRQYFFHRKVYHSQWEKWFVNRQGD